MAATALIRFADADNNPPAGEAYAGVGGTVYITNGDDTDIASWKLEVLYADPMCVVPIGVFASDPNGNTPACDFPATMNRSFRWRLQVWSVPNFVGAPDDEDIRVYTVPALNGNIIPPPQVYPPPLPDPASGDPRAKPNEMNFGGQAWGWAGTSGADNLLNNVLLKMFSGTQFHRWVDRGVVLGGDAVYYQLNGTQQLPFPSIQAAMQYIETEESPNTDWVVHIADSTQYSDSIQVPENRRIVLEGTDYKTCVVNYAGGSAIWRLSGAATYLALKNMRMYDLTLQNIGSEPSNYGTLMLDNASLEVLNMPMGTYPVDLVMVGSHSRIGGGVETAVVTGNCAIDGADQIGPMQVAGDFVCYNSLIPGSSILIGGNATIADTRIDAGSALYFVGYAPTLYVDHVTKYWLDTNNILIDGNVTVVLMAVDTTTPQGYPSKDITSYGTSYQPVTADGNTTLITQEINDVTIYMPDDAQASIPVGSIIYFQQLYYGVIKLATTGSSALYSRTSYQTTGPNSIIWALKTQPNTWGLGGDLLDAQAPYPVSGPSVTLNNLNVGRLMDVADITTVQIIVPSFVTETWPIGTKFHFYQSNVGQAEFVPADGLVTIYSAASLKTRTQWSACTLTKISGETWLLVGDLELL